MIEKIKGLIRIKEHIDEIAKEIENNKSSIISLTESINKLKSEFSEVKDKHNNILENQDTFISSFKSNLTVIEELRIKLENEISNFRLIKNQLSERVIRQLNEELNPYIEELRSNVKAYNELKSEIGNTSKEVKELNSELRKFMEISKNIKEMDFELVNYARMLEKNDREKLALMREVDKLRSLIARERRKR